MGNVPENQKCQRSPKGKYSKGYKNVINSGTDIGTGNLGDNVQRDRRGIRRLEADGVFCILSE